MFKLVIPESLSNPIYQWEFLTFLFNFRLPKRPAKTRADVVSRPLEDERWLFSLLLLFEYAVSNEKRARGLELITGRWVNTRQLCCCCLMPFKSTRLHAFIVNLECLIFSLIISGNYFLLN